MHDHRKDQPDDELQRDARAIARQLFGATVDDLEDRFRQAYQRGDRDWLLQQARRDPDLFMAIARRIDVQLPPPRLLPDAQIQQTHVVAPTAPPPDPALVAAPQPEPPRSEPARASGGPGAKTRRNPGWLQAMRLSDADMKKHTGRTRLVSLNELADRGDVDPRWAHKGERMMRNYETWWDEVRPG